MASIFCLIFRSLRWLGSGDFEGGFCFSGITGGDGLLSTTGLTDFVSKYSAEEALRSWAVEFIQHGRLSVFVDKLWVNDSGIECSSTTEISNTSGLV